MRLDVVTVGWLTLDDIVLTDHVCRPGVLGGGALYSAVGAQLWVDRVGIHSVAGDPSIAAVRARIRERGIDTEGLSAIAGNGLLVWLLHETETFKQQVPKFASSLPDALDTGRGPLPAAYAGARGFHVAPQTPAGSLASVAKLRALPGDPIITLDLLSDAFIDRTKYLDLGFLDAVTAFLPSEAEVERIWLPADPHAWLRAQAADHHCHIGTKLGAEGSVICDATTLRLYHVPAFPSRVVDTTGAGDAYCGGFLAGLVSGRAVPECAAMGTVSASYVVEACGALQTAQASPADLEARLQTVLAGVRPLP